MAFRRSFRKFRSFRRKRPALNWQKAQSPRKWNVGNFNIHSFIQFDAASPPLGEFQAQIIASPSIFLAPVIANDRALIHSIRRIDVGGIVWTQGIDLVQAGSTVAGTLAVGMQQLWTVNSLDTSAFAVGIDYPWGVTAPPTSNAPGFDVENNDEPLRILDRVAEVYSTADITAGNEGAQPVFRFRRSRSLRLKLPINEKTALCFTSYGRALQTIGPADELVVDMWVTGTIYYRYVH